MTDEGKYIPTELDILWAKAMIEVLAQHSVLAMPGAMLIYTVDKDKKRLVLNNPEQLREKRESRDTHFKTIEVFGAIGYEVF